MTRELADIIATDHRLYRCQVKWMMPSTICLGSPSIVGAMMPSPLLDGRAKATTPSRRLPCFHVEGSLIRIPTVDLSISIAYTRSIMPSPLLNWRAKATATSRRLVCFHVEGSLIRIPTVDSSISIAYLYMMGHWSSI